MKRMYVLFVCAGIGLAAGVFNRAAAQVTYATSISLKNDLKTARQQEVVEIPYAEVASLIGTAKDGAFKVVTRYGVEVPYQVTYNGAKQPQLLLVQVTIPAGGTVQLAILQGAPARVAPKTFGRYVPERKDDFAWENDKIAFRMYGKALENFPKENAYGMDVWVKRTSNLVVNKWYKLDDYHHDNGEGLDYYSVGLTLGAGSLAPLNGNTIAYPKNYTGWKVLDNGPLRTTFVLTYDTWQVGNLPVTQSKTISLDAGSQLSRVSAQFSYDGTDSLPVAIGIVRRAEPGSSLLNEQAGVMGYWEPQHGADGTIGVGCVFPQPIRKMKTDSLHLLTVAASAKTAPYVYYTGAAWNKAGVITSDEQWFAYLKTYAEKVRNPVHVEVIQKKK